MGSYIVTHRLLSGLPVRHEALFGGGDLRGSKRGQSLSNAMANGPQRGDVW